MKVCSKNYSPCDNGRFLTSLDQAGEDGWKGGNTKPPDFEMSMVLHQHPAPSLTKIYIFLPHRDRSYINEEPMLDAEK